MFNRLLLPTAGIVACLIFLGAFWIVGCAPASSPPLFPPSSPIGKSVTYNATLTDNTVKVITDVDFCELSNTPSVMTNAFVFECHQNGFVVFAAVATKLEKQR